MNYTAKYAIYALFSQRNGVHEKTILLGLALILLMYLSMIVYVVTHLHHEYPRTTVETTVSSSTEVINGPSTLDIIAKLVANVTYASRVILADTGFMLYSVSPVSKRLLERITHKISLNLTRTRHFNACI